MFNHHMRHQTPVGENRLGEEQDDEQPVWKDLVATINQPLVTNHSPTSKLSPLSIQTRDVNHSTLDALSAELQCDFWVCVLSYPSYTVLVEMLTSINTD